MWLIVQTKGAFAASRTLIPLSRALRRGYSVSSKAFHQQSIAGSIELLELSSRTGIQSHTDVGRSCYRTGMLDVVHPLIHGGHERLGIATVKPGLCAVPEFAQRRESGYRPESRRHAAGVARAHSTSVMCWCGLATGTRVGPSSHPRSSPCLNTGRRNLGPSALKAMPRTVPACPTTGARLKTFWPVLTSQTSDGSGNSRKGHTRPGKLLTFNVHVAPSELN
jgi:hypothetical protein